MLIKYRATKSLGYKGKHIRKGERVPADYLRLREGLRRGWVIEVDDPGSVPIITEPAAPASLNEGVEEIVKHIEASDPEPIPETYTEVVNEPVSEYHKIELEPKLEVVSVEEADSFPHSTEDIISKVPETADAKEILLDDLSFLKPDNISVLLEAGLLEVADLQGWTYSQLTDLKGIGNAKANQLLDAYDEYAKAQ